MMTGTWFTILGLVAFVSLQSVPATQYKIDVVPKVTGPTEVEVVVMSNIPGTVDVMLELALAGQKGSDIFIGATKRITLKNGRVGASIGKAGLPTGKYEVEVSFYPSWGPQDDAARAARISREIHARKVVTLKGTGESPAAAQSRANDKRWVMENVYDGTRWNRAYWVGRFGEPNQITITRLNPKVIKAYYFASLDMTIFVNELKGVVSHWRLGRATY